MKGRAENDERISGFAGAVKKRPAQGRTAAAWLPVILAPLLLAVIVSAYLTDALQNDAVRQNRRLVGQTTQKLEEQLRDVEDYAVGLSTNAALRGYVSSLAQDEERDVLTFRKLINAIPAWNTGGGLIDTCFVYVSGTHTLASGTAAYTRLNMTYDSLFRYGGASYEAFQRDVLENRSHLRLLPRALCLTAGRETQCPLLLQSIVNYSTGRMEGQILIYLSDRQLTDALETALSLSAVHIAVMDGENRLLAHACGEGFAGEQQLLSDMPEDGARLRVDGRELLISVFTSKTSGYTYRLALSMDSIAGQVGALRRIMLLYILLLLLLCLAAFLYGAARFRQPYQKVLKRLLPAQDNRVPYRLSDMERAVDTLLKSKREMEKKLASQKAVLTSSLYYRLVHGGMIDESHLEAMTEQADGDLYAPGYLGVLIEAPQSAQESQADATVVLDEALKRLPDKIAFSVALDKECVAALYKLEKDEPLACAVQFFQNLYESLRAHGGVVTQAYLGTVQTVLKDCPRSFEAARHLRECAAHGSTRYIVTYDMSTNTAAYDFTQEDDYFLSTRTAAGDEAAVMGRLDELEKRNGGAVPLNALQARLLVARMTDTLDRAQKAILSGGAPDGDTLKNLLSAPLYEAFAGLKTAFTALCLASDDRKKSHNHDLAGRILDYLKDAYADENLCLTSVSLHFGLNERYLSAFFKEQTGDTLSAVVQKMRVTKANELLKDGALTVAEVAYSVGYANPNTFRNAYKRLMGYAPSDAKKASGNP